MKLLAACLLAAWVSLPRLAASESARLEIICPAAVAVEGFADKDGDIDLQLSLVVDADGQLAETGWAWLQAFPTLEHPVRVTSASWDGDRLRAEVVVSIVDRWPRRLGGELVVTIDAERRGRRLSGEYQAVATVVPERERATLRRERTGSSRSPGDASVRVREADRASQIPPDPSVFAQHGVDTPKVDYIRLGGRIHAPSAAVVSAGAAGQLWPNRAEWWQRADQAAISAGMADSGEVLGARLLAAALAGDADTAAGLAAGAGAALEASRGEWFDYARTLAGLALAVDATGDRWADSARNDALQVLRDQAVIIGGLASMAADGAYLNGGPLAEVTATDDPRYVSLRAAAGLAALAVLGQSDALDPAMVQLAEVTRRSVVRFLAVGIGEHGSPLGHSAHDEMLEVLVPFVVAWEAVSGEDLADGTGLERTGSWLARSDGRQLRLANARTGAWQAFAAAVAAERDVPVLGWYAGQFPPAAVDLWQQCWLPATAPASSEAPNAGLSAFDERAGSLVARQAWTGGTDLVTIISSGEGGRGHGGLQRSLLVGGAHEWLQLAPVARGVSQWVDPLAANSMRLRPAGGSGVGAALPSGGGKVMRVSAIGRSANLGQTATAFTTTNRTGRRVDTRRLDPAPKVWQTTAVDYSGFGGADATLVLVGGAVHMGDRGRVLSLDLGPANEVPASSVRIDHEGFQIKLPGVDRVLAGRCIFPAIANATTRVDEETRRRWLDVTLTELDELVDGVFADGIASNMMDLDRIAAVRPDRGDMDFGLDDLDLVDPEEENDRLMAARAAFTRLYRVSTSHKMGDPHRRERVRSQYVIVLTIGSGSPPPVELAQPGSDHLLTIGDQRVTWWEYLAEFQQEAD